MRVLREIPRRIRAPASHSSMHTYPRPAHAITPLHRGSKRSLIARRRICSSPLKMALANFGNHSRSSTCLMYCISVINNNGRLLLHQFLVWVLKCSYSSSGQSLCPHLFLQKLIPQQAKQQSDTANILKFPSVILKLSVKPAITQNTAVLVLVCEDFMSKSDAYLEKTHKTKTEM